MSAAAFDDALGAFVAESRELLDRMEDALLRIEQAPDDEETVHAIFRAAHTIKGSAGIFGLAGIVAFTHVAESVLDRVRHGALRFDGALAGTFLSAGDHLRRLVDHVEAGTEPAPGELTEGEAILVRLRERLAEPTAAAATVADAAPVAPVALVADPMAADDRTVASDTWHLSLRFGADTLRNGFDPLSFLRYLETLGHVLTVITDTDAILPLSVLEPDACHLTFALRLRSDADKATIEAAFDFVREDSSIRILPPRSRIADYATLLAECGAGEMRLGEMLVRCGTLTRAELDEALDEQTTAGMRGTPVPPLGELLVARQQVHAEVVEAALAQQREGRREAAAGARTPEANLLRVDAARLDKLIDLVGELIIAGAGTALVARQHRIKPLVQATAALQGLMEQVRDTALNLRMVAIGGTFNRFQRVVRDVSQELGKDIALEIEGAETELDKTVVERLADPLTHLVRNAMDHGLEHADARVAAGKPARGTVTLRAFHAAGQVVIDVADDGRGLSRERIVRKGVEKGLVAADAAESLSDAEAFDLIFQPGFSTADVVSDLSGRGVGMDVVKRTIVGLRGSIELVSREGEGTTVRVRLPLTLAIIDGFLVSVGGAPYVVPLGVVEECVELPRDATADRDWVDLRGEVLPLVRLRELHSVEGVPGRRQNIVVVDGGGKRVGLVVDQLLGELQTVIKPLGRVFAAVPGVAGFTILGDGRVALLLDVPQLVAEVARNSSAALASPAFPASSVLADSGAR